MHRWTYFVCLVLVVCLVGCCVPEVVSLPSATPFPTAEVPTAISSPTAVPSATLTLEVPTDTSISSPIPPTRTSCPTLTPGGPVGQILFSAVECVGHSCEPFDGDVAPIYLINSDGSGLRQIYEGIGSIGDLNLSPDGTKLAFTDNYGRGMSNVYVLDMTSGDAWILIPDDTSRKTWGPRWISSDELVFVVVDDMNSPAFQSNLYSINVDGTQLRQLTDRPPRTSVYNVSVSPDGTQLLFAELNLDSDVTRVYRMGVDGTEPIELLAFPVRAHAANVAWSPTGDWMVFYPIPMGFAEYAPVYTARTGSSEITEIAVLPGGHILDLVGWTEDQAGMIFYACSRTLQANQIVKVQSDGITRTLALIEIPGTYASATPCSFVELSPDQQFFALSPFYPFAENGNLYVMDLSDGCCHQILSGYRVQSIIWLPM
jgi:hypothetical protein